MINTAVIDDHEAIRIGMSAALKTQPGHEVTLVAGAATVDEYLERMPDAEVVLLDLQLDDGSDPLVNAERLIEAGYKVLVYSIADNVRLLRRAPVSYTHLTLPTKRIV